MHLRRRRQRPAHSPDPWYPLERFTDSSKNALRLAQEESQRAHHSYIGSEHILLGLLRTDDAAQHILENLGVRLDQVRSTIEAVLGANEQIIIQQLIPTARARKVIEISCEEAKRMRATRAATEHLLLGLMIEGNGLGAQVLADQGVTVEKVRAEIETRGGLP